MLVGSIPSEENLILFALFQTYNSDIYFQSGCWNNSEYVESTCFSDASLASFLELSCATVLTKLQTSAFPLVKLHVRLFLAENKSNRSKSGIPNFQVNVGVLDEKKSSGFSVVRSQASIICFWTI